MFRFILSTLPDYPNLIKRILTESKISGPIKVLDLGAGNAKYWKKIESELPIEISSRVELTLMDAVRLPPISFGKFNTQRIMGIVPSKLSNFEDGSFHLVVAIDLIEHLVKHEGYRLLYEIDRVSEVASIIFTPNGFAWQPPSLNNEFNAHISGWQPKELKKLGWRRTFGQGGAKLLIGPYARPKSSNRTFLKIVLMTRIFLAHSPRYSFAFSAVKYQKNPRILNQDL